VREVFIEKAPAAGGSDAHPVASELKNGVGEPTGVVVYQINSHFSASEKGRACDDDKVLHDNSYGYQVFHY
jgi:hypothetical protein